MNLLLQQSSLHEETNRLEQNCQVLVAADRERAEGLAAITKMLNRVKEQSSSGWGNPSVLAGRLWDGGAQSAHQFDNRPRESDTTPAGDIWGIGNGALLHPEQGAEWVPPL